MWMFIVPLESGINFTVFEKGDEISNHPSIYVSAVIIESKKLSRRFAVKALHTIHPFSMDEGSLSSTRKGLWMTALYNSTC